MKDLLPMFQIPLKTLQQKSPFRNHSRRLQDASLFQQIYLTNSKLGTLSKDKIKPLEQNIAAFLLFSLSLCLCVCVSLSFCLPSPLSLRLSLNSKFKLLCSFIQLTFFHICLLSVFSVSFPLFLFVCLSLSLSYLFLFIPN